MNNQREQDGNAQLENLLSNGSVRPKIANEECFERFFFFFFVCFLQLGLRRFRNLDGALRLGQETGGVFGDRDAWTAKLHHHPRRMPQSPPLPPRNSGQL